MNIGGVDYREFLLDINQSSGQDKPLLSLDEIQVWQSNTPNTNVETFTAGDLDIPGGLLVPFDDKNPARRDQFPDGLFKNTRFS